jgi:hypothetical protein
MAITNPFAYNTRGPISGTTQYGDIAEGNVEVDYSSDYGGVKWWNGPDETLGYVIGNARPGGQPVPAGVTGPAYVGFWRSKLLTDESFLNLANYVGAKNSQPPFANTSDAVIWLNNNGYYTSYTPITPTNTPSETPTNTPTNTSTNTPTITLTNTQTPTNTPSETPTQTPSNTPTTTLTNTQTPTNTPTITPTTQSNLLVYLDSGNLSSYPTTGSTWTDLAGGNNNATLFNSPTYSSNYSGILSFDDASLEYGTIPNIGNLSNWTVEVWFRLTTALTGKVTSIVSNQFDLVNKLNFSIGTNNAPGSYNLAVGYYNGAWRTTTGFVPQINVWYQVVGTYDGSTIRQYVNGSASGGTLNYVGTSQSGGEVRLMRRWDETLTSGNLADGDLAIVKIYNTVLSGTQVLQNYNDTYTRFLDITPTPTPTNTQTPTLTLTPTNTQTPTNTPTNTPTPSTVETFFLLFEDGSIATAENNDNIEIDIV